MKKVALFAGLVLASLSAQPVLAEDQNLETLARAYIAALEASNQENVSDADRDALFDFYADEVVFEHVNIGMEIGPKDVLRAQSDQFRGWNRNVTLTITNLIAGKNVVVVEIARAGEQKDMDGNWHENNKTNVMVLEFRDGKIRRALNF